MIPNQTRPISQSLTATCKAKCPRASILFAALICLTALPQICQATALHDAKGSAANCVGIGPVVGKCIQIAQDSGLIKENELGVTGLTFGVTEKDDGLITAVQPNSAAAQAGLQPGDRITEINGAPVQPTPGMIATEKTFGARGKTVQLKVSRAGADLDVSLVRDPKDAPPGPESGTKFIYIRPMINWKGQFVPCMGAGPAGYAAIEVCYKIFSKDGYVKVGELGTTGFELDLKSDGDTHITAIAPDSAAAKAGLQPGDQIVTVDGKPLTESLGALIPELLFGKAGDHFKLTVTTSQGTSKSVDLVLGHKP